MQVRLGSLLFDGFGDRKVAAPARRLAAVV
jgi:hypothetical protein